MESPTPAEPMKVPWSELLSAMIALENLSGWVSSMLVTWVALATSLSLEFVSFFERPIDSLLLALIFTFGPVSCFEL